MPKAICNRPFYSTRKIGFGLSALCTRFYNTQVVLSSQVVLFNIAVTARHDTLSLLEFLISFYPLRFIDNLYV